MPLTSKWKHENDGGHRAETQFPSSSAAGAAITVSTERVRDTTEGPRHLGRCSPIELLRELAVHLGDEPLSVSTAQLPGMDDLVTGFLQPLQGGQRVCEFFMGWRHKRTGASLSSRAITSISRRAIPSL